MVRVTVNTEGHRQQFAYPKKKDATPRNGAILKIIVDMECTVGMWRWTGLLNCE